MAQDLGFRVSGLGLRALGLRLGLRVRALGLFPILGISAQGKCKLSRTGPKGGFPGIRILSSRLGLVVHSER